MVVEADKPGTVDMQKQIVTFSGNVVIVQGTMQIRADRVEVREVEGGRRSATAFGAGERLATYRQKREGVEETIQGEGERIEYDGRTDTLRFIGRAVVRRLRGAEMADEITGRLITWDNTRELFNVEGGAATPDNPSGRVRAILSPTPAQPSAAPPSGAPRPSSEAARPAGPVAPARPATVAR
jgi:lipopolysaccharide export system protein LptA